MTMSLATPKSIQALQRRLYLKAKHELSQASDGLARRMPLPRAICYGTLGLVSPTQALVKLRKP